MFEGVQDQFHQFIATSNSTTPQIRSIVSSSPHPNPNNIPLSFSLLHGCTSSPSPSSSTSPNPFPSVFHEPYNPHLHHQILQHQLGGGVIKQEGEREPTINTTHGFLSLERHRSMAVPNLIDSPWSHDEVLALLRIRSALDNWFPEFTWEQVSRKLSELGFKRSPQKCKEKFEEESRSFFQTTPKNDVTSIGNDVSCPTKNYRLFSELEELCHHTHDHHSPHHLHQQPETLISPHENGEQEEQGELENDEQEGELGQEERVHDKTRDDENDGSEATDKMDQEMEEDQIRKTEMKKSRKIHKVMSSKKKFEIFKSFCEEIVEKMMAQQEELHNKILQDMIKRDEEKIAREEAWKKQEMERINKEMEARARDFAVVSDRQTKIIEFLKKITSNSSTNIIITNKNDVDNEAPKSTHQNPSSSATHSSPNNLPTSSNEESISQTSNPTPNTNKSQAKFRKPRPNHPNKRPRIDNCVDGNDIGKRWPREEVLALINIRCNVDLNNKSTGVDDSSQNRSNNSNNNSNSNSINKNLPLWERISLKMIENGYNRSAKRCKEKWENINKYFRKTKDMNKNRSVDSRTCPYFHQLSHLYNQGRVTEGATHEGGGNGGASGGGGGGVSDQGEDVSGSGVQVTTCAPCVEF